MPAGPRLQDGAGAPSPRSAAAEPRPAARNPRIGLLGASFTTGNRGVDTLAAGAIRALLHRFPHASVFFLDYARTPEQFGVRVAGQVVPVQLVPMRFSKNILGRNHIARLLLVSLVARLLPARLRARVIEAHPCLRALHETDLLCALSGGDSFGDLYGFRRLVYVTLPQLLVLVNRKPLVLLPQSLGPFRTAWARLLARSVLRHADLVLTRDSASRDVASRLLGRRGRSGVLRTCPDVGFVVEPVAPARAVLAGLPDPFPPGQLVVGLNASGLLARGGYTGRNMFGLRENYNQLVARLIERLVERHHALVLLVPHTFGPPGSEADAPVCRQLYEEFACRFPGRVGWLAAEHAHDEIRHVIGRCDFFVGSRMHACIAALSQGVPTVAIAYSDKFRQALAPLDDGVTILDARSLGLGDILEGVAKALAERSHARGILDSRLPASRREVLDLFAPVAPFVAPPRR